MARPLSSTMTVELSAYDRQLLQDLGQRFNGPAIKEIRASRDRLKVENTVLYGDMFGDGSLTARLERLERAVLELAMVSE